ncbi:hypothetical protein EN978_28850, partial [Mesorhizobium sp. M7A.F.Ca.US.001.04.1.1]|uniref:PLP-dependent transferase n=1 Tax=Mesorhizobium sp. M7A.F.Ca.US.001.04.1.1 TaxID=2496726 RepID=UPI000FD362F1
EQIVGILQANRQPERARPDAELGIGPGTLRLSVGLEDADDLLEDIAQALKAR